MFSIFNRNKAPKVVDIAWLGVDVHAHLLPGIDDGAKNLEDSISLIRRLYNIGFTKLICTPHIFEELYPNTSYTILPVLEKVKAKLILEGINVEIRAAAEYMVDENFKTTDALLCLAEKYLLIEMSYLNETPNIEQVIFDLQIKGYQVILAHPERYNFYHKDYDRYRRLKDMGCIFQLNILSVAGYYGKNVKLVADYLLDKKMYDLAGTDLHHENHMLALEKEVTSGKLYEKLGHYPFRNRQLFS